MKNHLRINFTAFLLIVMVCSFYSSAKDTNFNFQIDICATEYFIDINSDDDFSQFNFPGDGSRTNPFIISGCNFSDSQFGGIYISNITKYVKIKECLLENLEQGIFVSKTDPGRVTIWNNVISYAQLELFSTKLKM